MKMLRDIILVACGAAAATLLVTFHRKRRRHYILDNCRLPRTVADGVEGLIGNTPLVRIRSLSELTGCEILAKAEFLNPGGSIKDRVALKILQEAFNRGALQQDGLITEGTAGSTGISLAMLAHAFGCGCSITMPDDAAAEKGMLLEALGASVRAVPPVSIAHPDHFVNIARREARAAQPCPPEAAARPIAEPGLLPIAPASSPLQDIDAGQHGSPLPQAGGGAKPHAGGAVFADQFENLANMRAHELTGAEIWAQTRGCMHAFVSGAGTGGTLAGVSRYLKARNPAIQVILIDPPGSGLYNRVMRGVMYAREEAEGKRLRNPFDTITEGIGINRLTANFLAAQVDIAFRGTDREAVEMAHHLLRWDGLFVGSSAAMNCVGAVKAARVLGPGKTIVTILCDGGQRHLSKFHSAKYLEAHGLTPVHQEHNLSFVM